MRVRPVLAAAAVAALAATTAVAAAASTAGSAPVASVFLPGLPDNAPSAAHQPEPQLPTPHGWPFGEHFSRTSGTGRLAAGAAYWTDFVYDDHGALGVEHSQTSSLAPTIGTYTYATDAAHGNGADIFRAAIGLDANASYWRVDWTTLVDSSVPIAEWALTTSSNVSSASAKWPAGAGVRSTGLDRALVMSSRGAHLLDAAGTSLATLPVTVDRDARSFIVRIPRTTLPVSDTWTVRLAAGVANSTGTGFAPVSPADGALPGEPAVYNVTFRTVAQEAASCGGCTPLDLRGIDHGAQAANANLWNETSQASTLARGDVSNYPFEVKWADLTGKRTTPDPLVRGSSTRWYVTTLKLGDGVVAGKQDPQSQAGGDLEPNYVSRIQPYAVHVPTGYRPGHAVPLTWVLHSLGVNHNQYTGLGPRFLDQLCDKRNSICATTLGFGPDGWYFDQAEVDFWQVWRELATYFTLDDTRTVISGYSMGGFASYKLGLTYPDLFAASMPLAGPSVCGTRVFGPVVGNPAAGHCTQDGDTQPLIANARWLPYFIADGVVDQLVPFTGVLQQVQKFDQAGERYRFWAFPTEDHIVYAVQDGFSHEVATLGDRTVVRNPSSFHYAWYPDGSDPALGLGPTGIYWLHNLKAADTKPGTLASVDASTGALPYPPYQVSVRSWVSAPGDPTPAWVRVSSWDVTGPAPAPTRTLKLVLSDVSSLTVDMQRAGLGTGAVKVTITTAAASQLRFVRGTLSEVVSVPSGTSSFTIG